MTNAPTPLYLQLLTPLGEPCRMYVLHVPLLPVPAEVVARIEAVWNRAWREAGREPPPGLIVLSQDMELNALTDGFLAEWGLMRIPNIDAPGAGP